MLVMDMRCNTLKQPRKGRTGRLCFLGQYHIMTTKSLKDIAKSAPTSNEELFQVDGVGNRKMEKYGGQLLALVNTFLEVRVCASVACARSLPVLTPFMLRVSFCVGGRIERTLSELLSVRLCV